MERTPQGVDLLRNLPGPKLRREKKLPIIDRILKSKGTYRITVDDQNKVLPAVFSGKLLQRTRGVRNKAEAHQELRSKIKRRLEAGSGTDPLDVDKVRFCQDG